MPEEFGGDLAGAEFWGADLHGALFRDVDLSGVTITHARVVDVEIDGYAERLVVNGVDVTDFVNEHDPWYPLRTVLQPPDPDGARASWALLTEAWAATVERARQLPATALHESVGGEWSFVETLRHLVLATDKWFGAPILGSGFHGVGLAHRSAQTFDFPGVDAGADPTLDEVLAVRAEQGAALADYLTTLTDAELTRTVDVLENGPHAVADCLFTVFEEEFWHLRYATRDLTVLEQSR